MIWGSNKSYYFPNCRDILMCGSKIYTSLLFKFKPDFSAVKTDDMHYNIVNANK